MPENQPNTGKLSFLTKKIRSVAEKTDQVGVKIAKLVEQADQVGAKIVHDGIGIGKFGKLTEISGEPTGTLVRSKENRLAFLKALENHSQLGIGKWAIFAQLKHFLENKGDLSVDQIIRIFNFYLDKIGITNVLVRASIREELQDIAKAVTIAEQKNEQLQIGSDLLAKSKNDKIALWGMGASLIPGFVYIAAIVGTNNSVEDINKKSIEIKITQSIGQLDLEKMETTILQNAQKSIIEQADYSVIRENLEFLARVCNDKAQRKLIIKILASLNKLQPKENTNKINYLLKKSLSETTSEIKAILEGSVSQKFVGQAKNSAEVIKSGIKPLAQQIGNLCRHLPFGQKEKIEKLSPENKAKAMVATRAFTMFAVRVAAPIAIANREALGNLVGDIWKNVSESVGGQPVFAEVPDFNSQPFTLDVAKIPTNIPAHTPLPDTPSGNFVDKIARMAYELPFANRLRVTTLGQSTTVESWLKINFRDNPVPKDLLEKFQQVIPVDSSGFIIYDQIDEGKISQIATVASGDPRTRGIFRGLSQFLSGQTLTPLAIPTENSLKFAEATAKASQENYQIVSEQLRKAQNLAITVTMAFFVKAGVKSLINSRFNALKPIQDLDDGVIMFGDVFLGGALAGATIGTGGMLMPAIGIGAGTIVAANAIGAGLRKTGEATIKHAPKFIEKIGRPMMESAQEKLAELQSRGEINIKTEEQKIVQFETKIAKINDDTQRTELLTQKENLEDFLIQLEHTQKGFVSEDEQLIKQKDQEYWTVKQNYLRTRQELEKAINLAEKKQRQEANKNQPSLVSRAVEFVTSENPSAKLERLWNTYQNKGELGEFVDGQIESLANEINSLIKESNPQSKELINQKLSELEIAVETYKSPQNIPIVETTTVSQRPQTVQQPQNENGGGESAGPEKARIAQEINSLLNSETGNGEDLDNRILLMQFDVNKKMILVKKITEKYPNLSEIDAEQIISNLVTSIREKDININKKNLQSLEGFKSVLIKVKEIFQDIDRDSDKNKAESVGNWLKALKDVLKNLQYYPINTTYLKKLLGNAGFENINTQSLTEFLQLAIYNSIAPVQIKYKNKIVKKISCSPGGGAMVATIQGKENHNWQIHLTYEDGTKDFFENNSFYNLRQQDDGKIRHSRKPHQDDIYLEFVEPISNPDAASEQQETESLRAEIQNTLNTPIGSEILRQKILALEGNDAKIVELQIEVLKIDKTFTNIRDFIMQIARGNYNPIDANLAQDKKDLQTLAQAFQEMDDSVELENLGENGLKDKLIELRDIEVITGLKYEEVLFGLIDIDSLDKVNQASYSNKIKNLIGNNFDKQKGYELIEKLEDSLNINIVELNDISKIQKDGKGNPTTLNRESRSLEQLKTDFAKTQKAIKILQDFIKELQVQNQPNLDENEEEENPQLTQTFEAKMQDISPNGNSAKEIAQNIAKDLRISGNVSEIGQVRAFTPEQKIDARYMDNQTGSRIRLAEMFGEGAYLSAASFKQGLSEAHGIAYAGSDYQDPTKRQLYKIDQNPQSSNYGNFLIMNPVALRNPGFCRNIYKEQSVKVSEMAKEYGDPFSVSNPKSQTVKLAGIGEQYLPMNVESTHIYPSSQGLDQYFEQMRLRVDSFVQLVDSEKSEENQIKAISLIAEFYQYGANARPWLYINNSLFMNQANLMLKMVGLNSIPHGILDHIAHRFQPENFERVFYDNVCEQNPNLPKQTQTPLVSPDAEPIISQNSLDGLF